MNDLLEPLPESAATRRKSNTRARLVRASLDVFVDQGLDGATIDDLVSAAGFTRGAFYSNFATKEEVFGALFAAVTDEVIGMVRSSVQDAFAQMEAEGSGDGDGFSDARMMVIVFEAIRPYARSWYLVHSEAVAHALRSDAARAQLNEQRHLLRDEIAAALQAGMDRKGERALIPIGDLAQLLVGVFGDLMLRELMDEADITDLATTTILGTMRAFTEPAG